MVARSRRPTWSRVSSAVQVTWIHNWVLLDLIGVHERCGAKLAATTVRNATSAWAASRSQLSSVPVDTSTPNSSASAWAQRSRGKLLGRNSSNSSKPPSSDTGSARSARPENANRKARRAMGRLQGKQPGVPGHTRSQIADPDVVPDRVVETTRAGPASAWHVGEVLGAHQVDRVRLDRGAVAGRRARFGREGGDRFHPAATAAPLGPMLGHDDFRVGLVEHLTYRLADHDLGFRVERVTGIEPA